MTRARIGRLAALAAALAIMIWLVARIGPTEIADELDRVGANAAWLLVIYVAGTIVGAFPFRVLFPPDQRPSVRATIVSRFAASGVNVIVPLFGMGGEPTRLLWLSPSQRAAGIAAIVLDRLTYAASSALFIGGGVIAALHRLPTDYAIVGIVAAILLLVGACVAMWLVSRHRLGGRLHRLLTRILRRTHHAPFGDEIDRAINDAVSRRRALLVATLLGFAARSLLGAEFYVAFRILDVELSFTEAYMFAAVPVLLTFIGAIVPGQLGIQEGSQALIARLVGIAPSLAVAAVLLTRIRQLVTAAIAWILIAMMKPKKAQPPPDLSRTEPDHA